MSTNSEIAALIAKAKTKKELDAILVKIREITRLQKKQKSTDISLMGGPELYKAQLQQLKGQVALRTKLIELSFAPQLKAENDKLAEQEKALTAVNQKIAEVTRSQINPLQAQIDANNYMLEGIALKEDQINQQYDTQISALDRKSTRLNSSH